MVGAVSNGKDMGGQLPQSVVLVQFHIFWVVNGVVLEGVYGDEDGAHVCVNLTIIEANLEGE